MIITIPKAYLQPIERRLARELSAMTKRHIKYKPNTPHQRATERSALFQRYAILVHKSRITTEPTWTVENIKSTLGQTMSLRKSWPGFKTSPKADETVSTKSKPTKTVASLRSIKTRKKRFQNPLRILEAWRMMAMRNDHLLPDP